ncbi:MAG: ABC transporter substrate-binding protein [Candidatus Scatovivens sp.]
MDRDYIKYFFIFIIIVFVVIAGGIFIFRNANNEEHIVDQTSKNTNIKKNLRLAISNFDTINPLLSNNKSVQEITKIIYDSLVSLNGDLKLEYNIAKEIGKTDNINYIIKIKDNIYWSNGEKLTSADIKFTIDTIKSGIKSIYTENLQNVSSLEIIDDFTVKIVLSKEVPFFEYYLTFPILSSSYYQGEDFVNTEKNSAPVCTGMYRISAIEDGKIKLNKNEYYWNKEKNPIIEEIDINLYNSVGEQYNAFKLGEIDILKVGVNNVEEYIGLIGYNKAEFKNRNYDFISFNTQNELLSDKSVRKAISLAIDKNNLIATTLGSGYRESNFFFDFESWLYDSKMNSQSNIDLAIKTLEENGWIYKNNKWYKNINEKNTSLSFNLTVNSADSLKSLVAENIAIQLSNIGIDININKVSSENYLNYLSNKNYDAMIVGIQSSFTPDLETFFGDNNIANYNNEEIKNILVAAKNTGNQDDVRKQYERLYDIYLEDVPYIGLYRQLNYVIYNQSLVCNLNPNSYNIFNNIEKWYRQ